MLSTKYNTKKQWVYSIGYASHTCTNEFNLSNQYNKRDTWIPEKKPPNKNKTGNSSLLTNKSYYRMVELIVLTDWLF